MERIYYLNGKKIRLKYLLSEIEQRLIYDGDLNAWNELGINFEDTED